MILHGGFTYLKQNQRELLFDVQIDEVYGSSGIFKGHSSERWTSHSSSSAGSHTNDSFMPFRQLLNVLLGNPPDALRHALPAQRE